MKYQRALLIQLTIDIVKGGGNVVLMRAAVYLTKQDPPGANPEAEKDPDCAENNDDDERFTHGRIERIKRGTCPIDAEV